MEQGFGDNLHFFGVQFDAFFAGLNVCRVAQPRGLVVRVSDY
jgi:hypothetical protein